MKRACESAKAQHEFGKPMTEYPGSNFSLAESATELLASKLKKPNPAHLLDSCSVAVKKISMSKVCSVHAGPRTVDPATQTHRAMAMLTILDSVTPGTQQE
jgi:alkylation response protein AidB-like acyl-CoA dehydrogenase